MEAYKAKRAKRSNKKTIKGVKALQDQILDILPDMVDFLDDEVQAVQRSSKLLGYAVWALVLFDVVVTYALLTLIK